MQKKIYVTVNKEGTPLLFTNEPVRTENTWKGNFFVDSILYKQIAELIKQSEMNFMSDPEILVVTL